METYDIKFKNNDEFKAHIDELNETNEVIDDEVPEKYPCIMHVIIEEGYDGWDKIYYSFTYKEDF